MAITPNYDLDVDTSLGGADASNYVISSQKAVKTYVDNHSGGGTVDQTFDGTSANAQSGVAIEGELTTNYQSKLVSGTNIKTINNTSVLGNGDIDTSEIFIATYGVTAVSAIQTAFQAGKVIFCKNGYEYSTLFSYEYNTFYFVAPYSNGTEFYSVNRNSVWSTTGDIFVTRPNAAVGDTNTPVYVNSSGVATSTGLSIANSRFNGQFVLSEFVLISSDTNLAAGKTKEFDLSTYLPNDSYDYMVWVCTNATTGTSSGNDISVSLYSDIVTTQYLLKTAVARTRTNSAVNDGSSIVIPVGSSRMVGLYNTTGSATAKLKVGTRIAGYMRIGTNT